MSWGFCWYCCLSRLSRGSGPVRACGKMTTERDTKCAFCRREVDPSAWCISFGNASVLGKEAVDQVCPDCILDGFEELDRWRSLFGPIFPPPHPFDCPGCPDCKGIKNAGALT